MISNTLNKICQLFLIGLILLINVNQLSSQNIKNPFEIKNRISSKEDSSFSNQVLDVKRDTIDQSDEQGNIEGIQENVSKTIDLGNENPFEVDHVPLRKKDVLKEQKSGEKDTRKTPSKSFIYWAVLIGLILLTLARMSDKKLFKKVFKSIFNENILKQEFRGGASLTLEYIILYLVYFINGGIFLLLVWNFFFDGEISFRNFGLCSLLLLGVYSIRHLTMNLLGTIFPLKKEATLYSFTIQIFNAFIGVCLIPINLFLAFGPERMTKIVLLIGFGLICILLIIRIVRGLTISLTFIFDRLILFFVYLCALEIAPILVLVKLMGKIN